MCSVSFVKLNLAKITWIVCCTDWNWSLLQSSEFVIHTESRDIWRACCRLLEYIGGTGLVLCTMVIGMLSTFQMEGMQGKENATT